MSNKKVGAAVNGLELPESVWAQIASKMSLRDWAMVSGSCTASNRVQLEGIDIADGLTQSGAKIEGTSKCWLL